MAIQKSEENARKLSEAGHDVEKLVEGVARTVQPPRSPGRPLVECSRTRAPLNLWAEVGVGGFCILFAGKLYLPDPYSYWSHFLWLAWWAGCSAFQQSIGSRLAWYRLITNAVITCLVIGVFAMAFYGAASYDEDGYEIDPGFKTTADSQNEEGVRVFGNLVIGAIAGVLVAIRVKDSESTRSAK